MGIIQKIFGSYSDKELKRIKPLVDRIEALEPEMQKKTDEELRAMTPYFKERLANGETLDDILCEAFAVVREASVRTRGQRPFRVQLIGGIILHQGRIAEMKTGEGKTLLSTLPAYLNALAGKGVHVVTVNEYLAQYQSEEMAQVHRFLGLTVGCILHEMSADERRAAYNCDITYATNNELGFDYLRDNMVVYEEHMVLRDLHYAIIDEVDSILIDEARTPLIISGSGTKSTQLYRVADTFAKGLKRGRILNEDEAMNRMIRAELEEEGDFVVDEKHKTTNLTAEGVKKAERFFSLENLSDPENMEIAHYIQNALKANYNMINDVDYMVRDNEIIIIDEHTGRPMEGRRYSDGLHQAIEAKEGVTVQRESQTLATITFQNFFNKYTKKSGMTGTAATEENEFREIYGMDVVIIPTNRPMIREDMPDVVLKTEDAKFRAIVADIEECHSRNQPVLVGTTSIDKSEMLAAMLRKRGIKCEVLNAKQLAKEAEIIALAGQPGAVTVATNMAGRGTDILLGEGVAALGGLRVIGTERHESRRIDNQLRGRSGRQGDPGSSRFYVSFDDNLMRIFGSDRMKKMVSTLGMQDDDPIENRMLTRSIEQAQKKVEGNNFSIRKNLLEFDQVMNRHREIIYAERRQVLAGMDLSGHIQTMLKSVISETVFSFTGEVEDPSEWDIAGLNAFLRPIIHCKPIDLNNFDQNTLKPSQIVEKLYTDAQALYASRETEFTSVIMRELERIVMLRAIDSRWMTHIDEMDYMRQGVNLQSYAQKNPIDEYHRVSDNMFDELMHNIQVDTIRGILNVRLQQQPDKREQVAVPTSTNMDASLTKQPVRRKDAKVGRNDPCPCGSGKKYKYCHGM